MENKMPENEIEKTEEFASQQQTDVGTENQDTQISDQHKKLEEELKEAKDKYLRLYSEFENFRRRTAKEKLEMIQTANEQLIKSILPVADDFERAEKSFANKNDKELEGFFLIKNKFSKILEQNGVKPMSIQAGADFNADIQEAITQIPASDETLKGKVIDVVEKGYLLNDKVIRYAKVVVGN